MAYTAEQFRLEAVAQQKCADNYKVCLPNDLHDAQQRLASMLEQAARQQGEIEALRKDAEELQATFDLTWSANLRAINRWREKTGQQLVFPHHDDLVIWLLAELEKVNPAAIASVATSQVKG